MAHPHYVAAILLAASATLAGQPLRLSPANPHYFEYKGKPLITVTSGEHYGAVLNKDFDYRRYLDALALNGLNATRIFSGAYREVPVQEIHPDWDRRYVGIHTINAAAGLSLIDLRRSRRSAR